MKNKRDTTTPREDLGGITGANGASFIAIDAKHLKIDGHDSADDKLTHDKSWKTKVEEEPNDSGDA